MAKNKITTSFVEVFKAKGETMEIAFKNLKMENNLDNYNLEVVSSEFSEEAINNGKIFKHSRFLYKQFLNGEVSEYTVFGALYNKKPIVKDPSRVIMHNIVTKGTKKWETVNSYRLDGGEILQEDTGTKAEAMDIAMELAIENNKTVNIVVSKRLVDMDGILGIAEFVPFDNIDKTNVYVFWVYGTKVEEEEEKTFQDATEVDDAGQYSIKEDLFSFYSRKKIEKIYEKRQ